MTSTLVALAVLTLTSSIRQQPNVGQGSYVVSGRVVDGTTGRAVNGAVIVLWERSKQRASGSRFQAPTGNFEIPKVSPGQYTIAAEIPGARFSYRTETVDLDVRNESVTGLGLIITPLGPRLIPIAGKLLMEGGTPLPASITRIRAGSESSVVQRDGSFQLQFRADEQSWVRVEELPEGTYIKSASGGLWNPTSEILIFSSTPPSTIQFTLAVGTRALRGRILDKSKSPTGSQAVVTLSMPSSPAAARRAPVNADGTFQIAQLRPGDYELKARLGSGSTMQSATVFLSITNQDRSGIDVVLKEPTLQKGRLVIEGSGRLEELQRFRPTIEVTDILGIHELPVRADGTFEFRSFQGEYSVAIRNLPNTYDTDITISESSVEVRVRAVQGDFPGLRLRPQR